MKLGHFGMLPARAFRPVGGRMTYEGGGKGDTPKPPDLGAAAEKTAEGNTMATTRRTIVGMERAAYRPAPENGRPSNGRVRKMGLDGAGFRGRAG